MKGSSARRLATDEGGVRVLRLRGIVPELAEAAMVTAAVDSSRNRRRGRRTGFLQGESKLSEGKLLGNLGTQFDARVMGRNASGQPERRGDEVVALGCRGVAARAGAGLGRAGGALGREARGKTERR